MAKYEKDTRPRVNLSPLVRKEVLMRDAIYVAEQIGLWNITHRAVAEAGIYSCTTTTVQKHYPAINRLKHAVADRVLEERYIERFPYAIFEALMFRMRETKQPLPTGMIKELMIHVLGQEEFEKRSFKELSIDEAVQIKKTELDDLRAMMEADPGQGGNTRK